MGRHHAGARRAKRQVGTSSRRCWRHALRHRRGQAVAVLLLASLVGACIVLIPLATRSLEQGVVKAAVTLRPAVDTSLVVDAGRRAYPAPELDAAVAELGPQTRAVYPGGVGIVQADAGVTPVFPKSGDLNPVTLLARDDVCAHLTFDSGRCPSAADEIAISSDDADAYRWAVGSTRRYDPLSPMLANQLRQGFAPGEGPQVPKPRELRIVGVYRQLRDDTYWLGERLTGGRFVVLDRGVQLDPWITPRATIQEGWDVQATRQYVLDPASMTVDSLQQVADELPTAQSRVPDGALIRATLEPVRDEVAASTAQIRLLVPLMLGQLAALVVVVLHAVALAAAQERHGEAALARLRGGGARGARRLLVGELLPPVLVGVLVGALAAFGIDAAVRRFVLPAGVAAEPGGGAAVAVTAALAAGWLAVELAVRPVVRLPVTALLQRLPQRARGAGLGTWITMTLAVAGVLVLRTSTEATPLALAAPTLVALAAGLTAASLLRRFGAALARRARGRGRVGPGLGWAAAARRPAGRLVVVVVAVATCAAVVAVNAAAVGARNRQLRAELETGAPRVVALDTPDLQAVIDLVKDVDPGGSKATVVAIARPADTSAPATLAVDPGQLARVAHPSALTGLDLDRLHSGGTETPSPLSSLSGTTLSVTVDTAVTLRDANGNPLPPALERLPSGEVRRRSQDGLWGLRVTAVVTTPDGRRQERPVGTAPLVSVRPATLSAPLQCAPGCRLDRLVLGPALRPGVGQLVGDSQSGPGRFDGTLTLRSVTVDRARVGPGDESGWQSWADPDNAEAGGVEVTPGQGGDLLAVRLHSSSGGTVELPRSDVPDPFPALIAGVPDGQGAVTAKGLTDALIRVTPTAETAQLPLLTGHGILVDRTTLAKLGARLGPRDTVEIWFGPDSAATETAVRTALQEKKLRILAERDTDGVRARYDVSGAAWGLSLALVAAALALLVAVGFVAVAAALGWRRAAADAACLRLAGVRAPTLRGAALRERGWVALVGAVTGGTAGLVGGWLAMPLVPLFTRPVARPLPLLDPDVAAVSSTWGLAALLAVGVAALAAWWTGRLTRLDLVREDS